MVEQSYGHRSSLALRFGVERLRDGRETLFEDTPECVCRRFEFYTESCTVLLMSSSLPFAETVSVTEASERGLSAVIRSAVEGRDIVIERHGRPQAVIIGMDRIERIQELERDLQSAALILSRIATDNGNRTDLDAVIEAFGFNRTDLQAELDADIKASRA